MITESQSPRKGSVMYHHSHNYHVDADANKLPKMYGASVTIAANVMNLVWRDPISNDPMFTMVGWSHNERPYPPFLIPMRTAALLAAELIECAQYFGYGVPFLHQLDQARAVAREALRDVPRPRDCP